MSEDTPPTKTCTKCGETYPATTEFFYSNRTYLRSDCKACSSLRAKRWRETNPSRHSKNNKRWAIDNPEKMAEKNKRWAKQNPDRRKEINKKYYRSNSKVLLEKNRLWKQENPEKVSENIRRANAARRARRSGVNRIPYKESDVLDLYGTICYICGEDIDLSASRKVGVLNWQRGLHLDHVVPLCLNGDDTLENVRPTHALCNIKKGHKDGP